MLVHQRVKAVQKWRHWKIESPSMCRKAETCTLLLTPCQGSTWVSQISPVMCVCVCPLSSFEFCKATPFNTIHLTHHQLRNKMWDVTFYEDSLPENHPPVRQATKGRITKTIRWTNISGRMIQPTNAGSGSGSELIGGLRCDDLVPAATPLAQFEPQKNAFRRPMKHWNPTLLDSI